MSSARKHAKATKKMHDDEKRKTSTIIAFTIAWLSVLLFLGSSIYLMAWGIYETWWEKCDARASIALFVVGGLCLVLSSAEFGILLNDTKKAIQDRKEKKNDGKQGRKDDSGRRGEEEKKGMEGDAEETGQR